MKNRSWRNRHNHWPKQESKNCSLQTLPTSIRHRIYKP